MPDHTNAIKMVLECLVNEEYGVIASLKEIGAVGHRVGHGGEKLTSSVVIDDSVVEDLRSAASWHRCIIRQT